MPVIGEGQRLGHHLGIDRISALGIGIVMIDAQVVDMVAKVMRRSPALVLAIGLCGTPDGMQHESQHQEDGKSPTHALSLAASTRLGGPRERPDIENARPKQKCLTP